MWRNSKLTCVFVKTNKNKKTLLLPLFFTFLKFQREKCEVRMVISGVYGGYRNGNEKRNGDSWALAMPTVCKHIEITVHIINIYNQCELRNKWLWNL